MSLTFEIKNNIGFITLNRPDKYNSVNKELALAFQNALKACEAAEVRAVYITGEGKAFCAGQDLAEIVDVNGPPMSEIVSKHFNPIILAIRNLQKPVIAAVNGVAAGAGANIALCCDITVATASASFIQAFSKIGLIPDSGGTYFLPRLIGVQKAMALTMLGDKISAIDAENMNMIYKVYPDETFQSDSIQLAETLAQMPTYGLWLTKKAINETFHNNLTAQLNVEDELQQMAGNSEDYKEGVDAFLEKRKANFKGK